MFTLQNISYQHLNKDVLFSNISLTLNRGEKSALIGNNGVGKSTLLKIITNELKPSSGSISLDNEFYMIPQLFGQYNEWTISEALQVKTKLSALHEILDGNASEAQFHLLQDDWSIETRCQEALDKWELTAIDLSQKMKTLSGGQKTKVFLAGLSIHHPDLILMDEPTNHLDKQSRQLLYDFIQSTKKTLLIVSHDRKLLNLLDTMFELTESGIHTYGGNYDFYKEQKELAAQSLHQEILNKEKTLKKAKEKERETIERQQKQDNRAKKNLSKAGLPKIVANTWKSSAEKSTAKISAVHSEKTSAIRHELQSLRADLSKTDQIRLGFEDSKLHQGKIIFAAENLNFAYEANKPLWPKNMNIQLLSGERIAIKGKNGSGKTTLIQIMLGNAMPQTGTVYRAANNSVYIDQDYSLIDNKLKIYEQAQHANKTALQEHEIKIRLNRFLFPNDTWDKSCAVLSGGEKMRLMLCCLSIGNQAPDLIILDEPTNNLDIQNIEILTSAINTYQGTLLVISHDEKFLEQTGIERSIMLS